MLRRLFYFLLLIVVAAGLWMKGSTYLNTVRDGFATTTDGLLQLAYLLTVIAFALVIVHSLLRSEKVRREMQMTGRSSERRAISFSESVIRLQTTARRAFGRRPVLASALLLVVAAVLAGIPIVLLALGSADGVAEFGPIEWLVVGLAEMPVLFVLILVAIGFMSDHNSSR